METNFITYSDSHYKDKQIILNGLGQEEFNVVRSYDREWLITTDFYNDNKKILDEKRGAGYWLWKPYIILDVLNKIEFNDIIFYLDCGDTFTSGLNSALVNHFKNDDALLTFGGHNLQSTYTKRDCFIKMDCDDPSYHNHIQLEAGIVAFKKTPRIMTVVKEWLNYCRDEEILTDLPNRHGINLPDFIDHRHDQSVLTNLAIKYGLSINRNLRKYVTCNVN